MSADDELRNLLSDTANELARIQTNPRTWLSWMVYLLARLEEKATNINPADKDSYVSMIAALQDAIRNRMRTGGWN